MSPAKAGVGLLSPTSPRITFAPQQPETGVEERLSHAFNEVREVLFNKLHLLLSNREDAQDTLQVTFLHCWQARNRLANVRNVHSWILRVGLNAGKDLLRNGWRLRAKPMALAPLCSAPAPPQILEDRERMECLRDAILSLPHREREVFLMRQRTGLPYEQIAKLLHTPLGTVKTRMRSAVVKLRLAVRAL